MPGLAESLTRLTNDVCQNQGMCGVKDAHRIILAVFVLDCATR